MTYENPQIPEGINVSPDHPLKDFFAMLAGVLLTAAIVIGALLLVADRLVRFIPFSAERSWWSPVAEQALNADQQAIEDYLQQLADQLAEAMALPPELQVTVHYRDDDVINAFATLGGHILVHRGLLETLDNENALALLIGHEVAHIYHRDPIVAMGRGITLALVAATLSGVGDDVIAERLLGQIGDLSQLSFSRSQERKADAGALNAVYRRYGHLRGADQLFEALTQAHGEAANLPLYRTHPLTTQRLEALRAFEEAHPGNGQTTDLPCSIRELNEPCDDSPSR